MDSIRHNIIFSVMVHSILCAAALIAGGRIEFRKASLITVLLFDERDNSFPGKQEAIANAKQISPDRVMPKTALKTVTKLSAAQEAMPKQNPTPLVPLTPQSEISRDSAPGGTGLEVQSYSSVAGSSSSSGSSEPFRSSSGDAGAASASRGQIGQATDTGTVASLKQRVRDTLQSNLIYPYIARKRRMEGTVLVDFKINQKGMAEYIRVLRGSGYAILDSAAMETVVKSSPFPLANYSIEVPITYRLTQD
jgi:TonB family protein